MWGKSSKSKHKPEMAQLVRVESEDRHFECPDHKREQITAKGKKYGALSSMMSGLHGAKPPESKGACADQEKPHGLAGPEDAETVEVVPEEKNHTLKPLDDPPAPLPSGETPGDDPRTPLTSDDTSVNRDSSGSSVSNDSGIAACSDVESRPQRMADLVLQFRNVTAIKKNLVYRLEPKNDPDKRGSMKNYSWNRQYPGLAIIICNNKFSNSKYNEEILKKNANDLCDVWRARGFKVELLENLKAGEIVPAMREIIARERNPSIAGPRLNSVGCVYFHVLSHGRLNRIYGSDLKTVTLSDVLGVLTSCDEFKGKPKIGIVDTCQKDHKQVVSVKDFDLVEEKDVFILFSTRWGEEAQVLPDEGALCTCVAIDCLRRHGVESGRSVGLIKTIEHTGEKTAQRIETYNQENPSEKLNQLCVVMKTTYSNDLYMPKIS